MEDCDDAPTRPTTAKSWAYAAVIALVATVVYANSFGGVFLYDDYDSIIDNRHIRVLWPLSEALSRPLADAAETVSTRPLLSLSLALNYAADGLDPAGYHAVNLLIHIAAAWLLYGLVRRTLGLPRLVRHYGAYAAELALATALLWVVHPLNTSAVTYIVQRAESLGGLLLLATMYAALRGMLRARSVFLPSELGRLRKVGGPAGRARSNAPANAWYLAAVTACLLGVTAKETVAAAPLLVLVYDAVFVSDSYRQALYERAFLYVGLAASWIPLYALLSADTGELVGGGRSLAYLATQPGILVHYLRLSLWPRPLLMSYEWPYASGATAIALPGAFVLALLAATVHGIWRRRWYGFLGAWFFLILAPSSSVFDLTQRIMEHRMYLPLAGVILCAVLAGDALLRRAGPAARARAVAAPLGVAIAVVALGAAAWARNGEYSNEVSFWRNNVAERPDNYIARLQLGRAYLRTGRLTEARDQLEAAVAAGPPFAPVHGDLGRALLALGEVDRAEVELRRAIALDPSLAPAHNNLGLLSERRGDAARAAEEYRAALAADSQLHVAHQNLARVLAGSGDVEAAERELAASLERAEIDADVVTRVGVLLQSAGQIESAERAYRRAVRLDPKHRAAYDALGTLLARTGRFDEARVVLVRALELDAHDTDALQNLGAIHAGAGRDQQAIETWERALSIDPRLPRVHFNLALLYERRGDPATAARLYRRETETDPAFALAWTALARVEAATGDVERARRSYRRAVQLDPDLAEAKAGLAALP